MGRKPNHYWILEDGAESALRNQSNRTTMREITLQGVRTE